jgi:hypothetical protein
MKLSLTVAIVQTPALVVVLVVVLVVACAAGGIAETPKLVAA